MDKEKNEQLNIDIEAPGVSRKQLDLNLPKPLTLEEKKYLLAVERGDLANVRRMIQKAFRRRHINVNCVDSLGRGALTLAIEGENLEMVEVLVILGVQTKDALLHAINSEFVEAVELLLEHEELIYKEGEAYSWQKVDYNIGTFTPDITPLVLAAHKNNYEILKILLDRGATLPMPHDIKCGCDECIRDSTEDSLRHSLSRVNEYRALASPSLIALSSSDPLLTAFQLSWELRTLAFTEQECKSEYLELRHQCQQFAVDLLDQSRSSQELAIILNHDPDNPPEEDEHMQLTRLVLAIEYKQKKFVAHPNIQQLLAALWYEGVPGFRRKSAMQKLGNILHVAALFPFYCCLYIIAPNTSTGKLMRKPFMKFLIHASAYLFFLFVLILVSLRAEVLLIELFGTAGMKRSLEQQLLKQRGNGPSMLELLVLVYVLGYIWEETHEIYVEGIRTYLRNMWNFIDFTRNSLYCAVALLRFAAYLQQMNEISKDPSTAYIPRENWDAFDPQLIAEGLFAAANVFSALKLVHLFSINPHLGPLQISLGRMVIDIVKFFFIYSLVLFAFACGLNQLLWYFADLERKKCYVLPGGLPDWDHAGDSCMKWRSFGNVFEASQSLFWASFGMVGLENFELAGIKSYTRFWGLLMFGSYSVINVIVLLNLLIAMMSNSYAIIEEHSDTEWKFARTRLWMSYFEESSTLPPPFNIFPTPKLIFKLLGMRKKDKLRRMSTKRRNRQEKERDYRYTSVMRALVWRYVSAMHRRCEENPVTEDDINEVKGDISAFRYELLDILEKSGMDVSDADRKGKAVLGKKMKVWERRLMKDFHLAPIAVDEDFDQLMIKPENEEPLAKFRRIAKLAILNSSSQKWGQVVAGICASSQIGRCNNKDAYRNQQTLQKAMEEARKLVMKSPAQGQSRCSSPIQLTDMTSTTLKEILREIKQDVDDIGAGSNNLLQPNINRSASPLSILSQMQRSPAANNRSVSPFYPKSPSISPPKSSSVPPPKPPKIQSPDSIPKPKSKPPSPPGSPSIKKLETTTSPSSQPPTPEESATYPSKPESPECKTSLPSTPKSITPVQSRATTPPSASAPSSPETKPETPTKVQEKTPETEEKEPETESPKLQPTEKDEVKTEELIDVKIPETKVDIVDESKTDDSPTKILKRKAPAPAAPDGKPSPDIAISRPVPPERTGDQGMIPPPPTTKPKAPAPQVPVLEVTPASDSPELVRSEKIQEPQPSTSKADESAAVVPVVELVSMPSTEKLIPKEEEKPSVPVKAKPTRRQPKTGWL